MILFIVPHADRFPKGPCGPLVANPRALLYWWRPSYDLRRLSYNRGNNGDAGCTGPENNFSIILALALGKNGSSQVAKPVATVLFFKR